MIDPENEILPDDSNENDPEDQMSQQDIHGNGLDDIPADQDTTDTDILKESYDASESAYTLKLDGDKPAQKKK